MAQAQDLPPTQLQALQEIRRLNGRGFTGLFSGRVHRARTMRQLEARGLVRPETMVACDGDGFALDPERWRTGWTLTTNGKRALLGAGKNGA